MDRSDTNQPATLGRGRSRGRGRGILAMKQGWGRGFSVTDENLSSPPLPPQTRCQPNPGKPSESIRQAAIGRGVLPAKALGRGDVVKSEEGAVAFPRSRGRSLLNSNAAPPGRGPARSEPSPLYLDADFVELDEEDDAVQIQFQDYSDSSDDDLMAIGRQLNVDAPSSNSATGNLSAFASSSMAGGPRSDLDWPQTNVKKALEQRNMILSSWRVTLRQTNIKYLGPLQYSQNVVEEIRQQWQQTGERAQPFSDWFLRFLRTSERPFQTAAIAVNAFLSNKKKEPMLVQVILECLKSAEVARSGDGFQGLRRFAFFLVQREGLPMARQLVAIFRLNDEAAESDFGPLVDELVEGGIYLEAGQLIGLLNLHARYPVEKVMLPLIAENRLVVVEECVEGHVEEQKRLLLFLDQYHDKPEQLLSFLRACRLETLQLKKDHLSQSALRKLALRLLKKFGLPKSTLPSISLNKGCYDVAHLVYERYVRRLYRDDWKTAVLETVGDVPGIAKELVRLLMEYRAGKAARYWAERLAVPADEFPGLDTLSDAEEEEEAWELGESRTADDDEFLRFSLKAQEIFFVNDEDGLWRAISSASGADKLGFDMEWTTPYGSNQTCVSILQMALSDCVFIIDVSGLLLSMEEDDAWISFREQLLENARICKLFYSAYQDLLMLWHSVPVLASPPSPESPEGPSARTYRGVVDLEEVASACTAYSADFFPRSDDGGLSGLVASCLGKPLDKSQRLSNWRRRPLSSAQLVYAALDAHCLIGVHDWMEERKEALGLASLDLRPPATLHPPEKKKKKRKGKAEAAERPGAPSSSSSSSPESRGVATRPSSLLLAVDPPLQEAGQVLRACGCLVEFAPVQEGASGRTVVATADRLRLAGAQGVAVDETAAGDRQAASVLNALEVHLLPQDFVGPCATCAVRDFVELSPDAVAVLKGDLSASMSAREQKRLMKRGVDVESRSVVRHDGDGEKPIHCPESVPDVDLFFLCRSCGRLAWERPEQRELRIRILRLREE